MGLFLFRFLPVLLPLLIYWLWLLYHRRKATKAGEAAPRFRDGPWYWAVIASLAIGFCIFIFLGSMTEEQRGVYVPPHIENGRIIDGQVKP